MNKVEILKQFIKDNNLAWNSGHRNTPSVILSGFALAIGATLEDVQSATSGVDSRSQQELERVFDYAESYNYGDDWFERFGKSYKVDEKLFTEA